MGLFGDKKPNLEEYLLTQVEDLTIRLAASEKLRNEELARHEQKEQKFFEVQQDLINTIMLLKGVPIRERDDNGELVEVKPTPSVQRRSWSQITTGLTLESRKRREANERLEAQRRQPA